MTSAAPLHKTTNDAPVLAARIPNPAMVAPGAMSAILALAAATRGAGVSEATLELTHLRASQINSCGACLVSGGRSARKAGETDDRLVALAGWREAPFFTEAERAALALTEAMTRLSDRADPVPDEVWAEVTRHFDESALAVLVLSIATTNLFNRINVSTRQIAGDWG